MVVHIRLVTEEQLADQREAERFRELWEENDSEGMPPPWRSLPIRVWALLKTGPHTASEIAEELRCGATSAYSALDQLRRHKQNIVNPRGRGDHRLEKKYHLLDSPPLKVIEGPQGMRLLGKDGVQRRQGIILELK